MSLRDKAVISGVGETRYVRAPGSGKTPIRLQMEAALTAIADAGLTPKDIDGDLRVNLQLEGPADQPLKIGDRVRIAYRAVNERLTLPVLVREVSDA